MRDLNSRFSAERRAVVVDLLRSGIDSGDLPPSSDPELLADAPADVETPLRPSSVVVPPRHEAG